MIAIRGSTYRGQAGFKVYGRDTKGRVVRIFVRTKKAADVIKGCLKRGEELTVDNRTYVDAILGMIR